MYLSSFNRRALPAPQPGPALGIRRLLFCWLWVLPGLLVSLTAIQAKSGTAPAPGKSISKGQLNNGVGASVTLPQRGSRPASTLPYRHASAVALGNRLGDGTRTATGATTHRPAVTGKARSSSPDYQPLVDLYNATNGPGWGYNGGWLSDYNPCGWFGVRCDENERVTGLNLSSNQLSGTIPASLSALTNLQTLYFFDNQLTGSIPASLGTLTNLQFLDLDGNQLTGSIPASLSALTNLQSLYLNNNQLTGSIPASLGGLTNLYQIDLNTNLLSGGYPASFKAFCGISKYFVENPGLPDGGSVAGFDAFCATGFSSNLAVSITANPSLTINQGSSTQLTASGADTYRWSTDETTSAISVSVAGPYSVIGTTAEGVSNIATATVTVNAAPAPLLTAGTASGSITACQGTASAEVQSFTVAGTNLTTNLVATAPTGFEISASPASGFGASLTLTQSGGSVASTTLYVRSAATATGSISGTVVLTATGANTLGVALEGTVNPGSPDYQPLVDLYNATNGPGWTNKTGWLTDCTPCGWYGVTCDGNGRVTGLNLSGNQLSGSIPASLSALTNLQQLYLFQNQLSGSIPASLGALTNLQRLDLSSNQLNESIPASLSALTNLEYIYLGYNQLSESIPASLSALTNLQYLNLAGNQLSGSLPASLGALANLKELYLHANQLSGSIPASLGALTNLQQLYLNNNQLSGSIPASLSALTNLQTLSFYDNQLTGSIPASLGTLTNLQIIYLSQNQLSGCYPASLKAFCGIQNYFAGNPGLPDGGSVAGFDAFCATGFSSNLAVSITANPSLSITQGSSVQLTASGADTYRWSTDETTSAISVSVAGPYSVTATTAEGCSNTATATVTVNVPPGPTLTAGMVSGRIIACQGTVSAEVQSFTVAGTNLTTDIVATAPTGFEISASPASDFGASLTLTQSGGSVDSTTLYVRSAATATGSISGTVVLTATGANMLGVALEGTVNPLSPDYQPLVDLYNATNGPGWRNKAGWLTDCTPCGWYGVTCDESGRVTKINLDYNQLSGSIPASLSTLSNLREFSLTNNQLSGSIPTSLGVLTTLQYLSLESNRLSDSIPASLSALTNLRYLSLAGNQLSGSIPASLGALTNLKELYLNGNELSGSIPASLSSLTNLQYLYLFSNQLSGSIPASLGALTSLEFLSLSDNQLSGSIPASLSALSSLQRFYLQNNQLSLSIPASLGALTSLQQLYLQDNQLSGSIPASLGALTSLQQLYLQNNHLSGSIPASLSALNNLQYLHLFKNQLSGSIPASLSALTSLRELYLFSNQLSGSIPASLGALTSLQELYLNNNQLSGCYPAGLATFCGINANFSGNPALPDGGSYDGFAAFCATGFSSNLAVSITANPSIAITQGSSVQLTASGADTYTWSTDEITNAISVSVAGPYSVTGTTAEGCSNTATATVTVNTTTTCDASTWTARSAAEANEWNSVAYGNGQFVAVATDGTNRVMTSPDGITWTPRTAAQASEWKSVTYGMAGGNPQFVAVAQSGTNRAMTSPDGITWTARSAAEANVWASVTYGNGLFVAVANSGANRVMTSPDGITWTPRMTPEANVWASVTYGNGQFVAVAINGSNQVMTSPDGITWTGRSAAEANQWLSVAYGNGLFVAVANTGTNRVMTSRDGITWTAQTAAEANGWISVTYGNGQFVAVAYKGTNRVMTSPDGTIWVARKSSEDNSWYSVTYGMAGGNPQFVAVATDGNNQVMTACDAPACSLTVAIAVMPSLTLTSGGSVTLTASGADSYTWSNGSTQNPLIVSNITSATTLSVTGVTGTCSATASVAVSVTQPAPANFCNTVVYVTESGNGQKNGSSWANALAGPDLAPAVASACASTTFLVANGLYKPTTSTTDRTASFSIASGVEVYGGYAVDNGVGTRGAIDPTAGTPSSTTFSGDIDGNNTLDDGNSYHVVWMQNVGVSTRLDGLVIMNGKASGSPRPASSGGGIYNEAKGNGQISSPIISNCLLTNHDTPRDIGGAMYSVGNRATASPTLINCVFRQNTGYAGAALYNDSYFGISKPTLTNCIFTNNTATRYGGAIFNNGYAGVTSMTAINCRFSENLAQNGGAVCTDGCCGFSSGKGVASSSSPVFQSCTFTTNRASATGGAMYTDGSYEGESRPILTDCVFASNTAGAGGGAIYATGEESGTCVVGISGSTFTNNVATGSDGGAIYSLSAVIAIQNSSLTDNQSDNNGGAIYSSSGGLQLTNVIAERNQATGSNGGGALYSTAGSVTITGSSISRNTASSNGGAIKMASSSRLAISNSVLNQNQLSGLYGSGGAIDNGPGCTLTLESTTLAQNSSNYNGGAINNNNDAVATLTNCVLSSNSAKGSSGAGGAVYNANNTVTRFAGSTFTGNLSLANIGGKGGAIYNNFVTQAIITDCAFEQNVAPTGGAVYNAGSSASYTLTASTFTNNTATASGFSSGGGAIVNDYVTIDLTNCRFVGNVASNGGAVKNSGGIPNVLNSYFERNQSVGTDSNNDGGGALNQTGQSVTSRIESSTFVQNTAMLKGGGVWATTYGVISLTNCTFASNTAPAGGGAYLNGNFPAISNSRFTQNSAATGGALYFRNGFNGMTPIRNSLFSRNTASSGGGAIYAQGTSLTVVNGSFSGNTAPAGTVLDMSTSFVLSGALVNSIIWSNGSVANNFTLGSGTSLTLRNSIADPGSSTYTDGGSNKTLDPGFTSAASDDLTVSGCSPAINAGTTALNSTSTDLAGNARVFGGTIDMGAYEYQSAPTALTVSIAATPSLTVTSGGSVTLTASGADSYTWSNGSTQNPLIVSNITSATTLSVTGITGTCSATATAQVSVTAVISCDASTWTASTAAEANSWRSVTYGNGQFVAVAENGINRVMTSPDGITWTPRTAAQANLWTSVTYGNGLFVAVAENGTNQVMTSPDGITWTGRTAAEANLWRSVTYSNGLFVAVAIIGTNRVMTSPDGLTWTARTTTEANFWNSVTYGNGLFVAVASSGTNRVMTSCYTPTATPAITLGTVGGTATGCVGMASSTQSFTVSGNNLTDNLLATAPAGFELSTNATTGFASLLTLAPSGGAVASTTLFVRTTAGATMGTQTGTVVLTSAGATSQSADVSATVNAPPLVSITATPSLTVNSGQSTTLTASGATTYLWSNGATTATTTVNVAAPYSVTGTTSGCSSTTSVTLFQRDCQTTVTASAIVACVDKVLSLTATAQSQVSQPNPGGPALGAPSPLPSYSWVAPSGATLSSTSSSVISASFTTTGVKTFTATVTTSEGCVSTNTVSVIVNALPTPAISGNLTICAGQSTTLTASGGMAYVWSNGGSTAAITVSPVSTTAYSVTVTNASGCVSSTSVSVTVNPLPVVSIAATPSLTLNSGQSTTLTASGATAYLWSNGATTATTTVNVAAPYSVTGTTSGCSSTTSVTLFQRDCQTTVTASAIVACVDKVLSLTATAQSQVSQPGIGSPALGVPAGPVYSWVAPAGATLSSTSSSVISASFTTTGVKTFTATVTTLEGCVSTNTVSVIVNALPTPAISGNLTICAGQSTTLTASGGMAYVWSNGGSTAAITVSPVSTTAYSVTVTNASGCVSSTSVSVTVNPLPLPTLTALPSTTLTGGLATTLVAGSSGAPAVSYVFSGTGLTSQSPATGIATANQAGVYSVTLTTASGCTASTSLTLTLPTPLFTSCGSPTATLGQPLQIIEPAYNCTTGLLQFRTLGGDGSPITYSAIGVTSGTSSCTAYLNAEVAQDIRDGRANVAPFTLVVQQGGLRLTYSWNALATCASQTVSPNQAPIAPVISEQTAQTGVSFSFTVPVFTDPNGDALTYTVVGLPANGLRFNADSRLISGTPSLTGVVSLTAIASDPAGLSASAAFRISVVAPVSGALNVAPVAPAITGQSAVVGQAFVLAVPSFSDANGDALVYTALGLPANGLSFDATSRLISGTPSTTGVLSVTIKATDPGGLSATTSFSLFISASAVTGGALTLQQPLYDCQTGAFSFRSSGGDGSGIEYRAVGITDWSSRADGFTVLPASDAGPFQLQARQRGVTVSLVFDWKGYCAGPKPPVENQPPVAPLIGNQTATVGQFFTMTIPAFPDANGDVLSYGLTQVPPSGLSFNVNTRVLSGTPSVTGVIGISVLVTDPGGLTAVASFSITVGAPVVTAPIAPVLPSQTATVGVLFSYVVPAFSGTAPLVYSISNLPAGLSFDNVSRLISGTASGTGVSTVVISASNVAGQASGQFTLTVSASAVTPTGPATLTITSFSCAIGADGSGSVAFVAGYSNGTFSPSVPPLFINGVTASGVLGQAYTFRFDGGVTSLFIADNASRSLYFAWDFRSACAGPVTPPQPPVPTAPVAPVLVNQTATVGNPFSYVVPTFSGTAPISYSATGLPTGLSFNASSRTISGTPSLTGISTVVISASNVAGQASGQFTLTVSASAVTPTGPATLTITSFSCTIGANGGGSVNLVVGYTDGSFAPALPPLFINGVTASGQLGQTYTVNFDGNQRTVSIQDQASRSTYFVWDYRAACGSRNGRLGVETVHPWQAVVVGNPPVDEYAQVALQHAEGQTLQLRVSDLSGHAVSTQSISVSEANQRVQVRLGESGGVYLLQVSDGLRQQTLRLLRP